MLTLEREYLTVEEVAELLRCSRRTVERLPLRYAKVGRKRLYPRDEVDVYLKEKVS